MTVRGRHLPGAGLLVGFLLALAVPDAWSVAAGQSMPSGGAPAAVLQTPPPPAMLPVDHVYLLRVARRTMRAAIRGETYTVSYIPPSLEESARVSVTLRRNGRLLGTADSAELPIAMGCQQAARQALANLTRKRDIDEVEFDTCQIEVEVAGPRQFAGTGRELPELLAQRYVPGIEGIAVDIQGREILVRPSQLISMETFCTFDEELEHHCDRYAIAIDNLQKKLGLRADPPEVDPAGVKFSRFRTVHLFEPEPGADPVELVGGVVLLPQDRVNSTWALDQADGIAAYMRYRQAPGGLFSYEFLPGRDMYWPDQNWVRQTASLWALATHARVRRDAASEEAVDRGIAVVRGLAQPLEGHPHALYVATPDGKHPLGCTALACLAMLDAPHPERYDDLLVPMITAMVSLQNEDGSFRTAFPPARSTSSQDYFPGEALLAIVRQYERSRDARLREVCDRALPFYRAYFAQSRPPAFVPWQAQAWGRLARTTRLQRYADFVYEMTDFIVSYQVDEATAISPVFVGGYDVHGIGRTGISSAVYLEGVVEAWRTASALGDRERAARYAESVRRAARFVAQLRFRPEECYYVQSPRDVVGGLRNTPADPTLRIDHCQHALAGLLGAAEVLAATSRPAPG